MEFDSTELTIIYPFGTVSVSFVRVGAGNVIFIVTKRHNIYLRAYLANKQTKKHCSPTFSFPIFGAWMPGDGLHISQLPAHHFGCIHREVIVAHGPPLAIVENLHSALVVFPLVSCQSELDARRVRCQLRGSVLLLLRLGVGPRWVAQVLVLGQSQL